MIIKNKELMQMLKEYGRQYTLTMYINHKIILTKKQYEFVYSYKDKTRKKFIKKGKC